MDGSDRPAHYDALTTSDQYDPLIMIVLPSDGASDRPVEIVQNHRTH